MISTYPKWDAPRPMRKIKDPTTRCVYDFIQGYIAENGYAPSQREIAANCYVSKSTVSRHLDRLEIAGHLYREIGQPRSITLLTPPSPD